MIISNFLFLHANIIFLLKSKWLAAKAGQVAVMIRGFVLFFSVAVWLYFFLSPSLVIYTESIRSKLEPYATVDKFLVIILDNNKKYKSKVE